MRLWREFHGNRLNVTSLAADERVQCSEPTRRITCPQVHMLTQVAHMTLLLLT